MLLGLLPLTACSDDPPAPTYSASAYEETRVLLQRTLNARARGLRERDATRFRRTLHRADATLVEEQQVYFDNVTQLPFGVLRYKVLAETIKPQEGTGDYWAEAVFVLQLDGYDAAPVRTRDRFRFTPSADGRRMLVASTTDARWEADHPDHVQPWDLGPIHVDQSSGVLGIFDDVTARRADEVVAAATDGRYDVRAAVGPNDESPTTSGVVIYSLQDPTFLRAIAGQTVGDPDRADGLTIAVPIDATDRRKGVASYRIFLNPRVLDEPTAVLGRLVRHELTHATLRERGNHAPLWLTEGIAEYVSVRPMPPDARRLPARALPVAATAHDLPGEEEFAGGDAEAWYAVAWWVCEYVAGTYGEPVLFALLDRLDQLPQGGDQAAAIQEALGITPGQLVQRGAALMTATYGRTG